jgi:DNA-binding ferritin-like protein (Dps family)
MGDTALIQVLGAITYGEWKAHEGARAKAAEATNETERKAWKLIAAQELRHFKGFSARLEAMGADPDRAMRPFRGALDHYHGAAAATPLEEAIWSFFGEGIADDLLVWLRKVVDTDTAAFIDTVLADEEEHEARAAAELRALITSAGPLDTARAVRRMVFRMATSGGRRGADRLVAFLRVGRPVELVGAITGGYLRRMREVGLVPFGAS